MVCPLVGAAPIPFTPHTQSEFTCVCCVPACLVRPPPLRPGSVWRLESGAGDGRAVRAPHDQLRNAATMRMRLVVAPYRALCACENVNVGSSPRCGSQCQARGRARGLAALQSSPALGRASCGVRKYWSFLGARPRRLHVRARLSPLAHLFLLAPPIERRLTCSLQSEPCLLPYCLRCRRPL